MNELTQFGGDIPEPTDADMVRLRAEARRVLALPPGPDEYDELMTGLSVLAAEGGRWVS